jgi:hypothetical protein
MGMADALEETRWLTPRHRQQLAEGKLRLPDQANHFGYGGHPAVLMSVSDGFGPVAWIDRGMAELIWRLNYVHGIATEECCQGHPGYDRDAYIAFCTKRGYERFIGLAGGHVGTVEVERGLRVRVVRFSPAKVVRVTRVVRNA